MSKTPPTQYHAFTRQYNTLSRVIDTPVQIFNPFTSGSESTQAIWDTGATGSVITNSLATRLGLVPIAKANVKGVHGQKTVNVYAIKIVLSESVQFVRQVTECDELSDDGRFNVLIGMDIINEGDFAISNFNGCTIMTFRVPSLRNFDFVSEANAHKPIISQKQNRNDRCACGSGKKFKDCHGR